MNNLLQTRVCVAREDEDEDEDERLIRATVSRGEPKQYQVDQRGP